MCDAIVELTKYLSNAWFTIVGSLNWDLLEIYTLLTPCNKFLKEHNEKRGAHISKI